MILGGGGLSTYFIQLSTQIQIFYCHSHIALFSCPFSQTLEHTSDPAP